MKDLYFVVKYGVGISYFNNEDGAMTCIRSSENKDEWQKFILEDAVEVRRHTGYDIVEAD